MAPGVLSLVMLAAPAGPATFRAVSDATAPSVLRLGAKGDGTGVIVGTQGEVLTAAALCESDALKAATLDGTRLAARRVRVDPDSGLCLLALPEGAYRAVPAATRLPKRDDWVVAVALDAKSARPAAGLWRGVDAKDPGVATAETPTRVGAPIFDTDGRLVGIALRPARGHAVNLAPLTAIRAFLQAAP